MTSVALVISALIIHQNKYLEAHSQHWAIMKCRVFALLNPTLRSCGPWNFVGFSIFYNNEKILKP